MNRSPGSTQLTLLPQPHRGEDSDTTRSLKNAHRRSAPNAPTPIDSTPSNGGVVGRVEHGAAPSTKAIPSRSARHSLWYCLYLPQLASLSELEQRHCLDQLAQLSQQFSSAISLHPQALVFEIRSGLNYFGGAESLHAQYQNDVEGRLASLGLGPQFHYAACPTVEGSLLLARGGGNTLVYRKENLHSALGQLPIDTLRLKAEPQRRLTNMGIRRLGDLWRLPPAGLRRRFGSDFLGLINKALGKAPEPIKNYLPPPAFVHSYELPYEVENTGLLRPVVDEMVAQLCDFLRHRDLCASSLSLSLVHERRAATTLEIGLRQASRSQQHLMLLVDTHFDTLQIPAAVISLRLEATQFDAFISHSESLLMGSESPSEEAATSRHRQAGKADDSSASLAQFMERLQARLGSEQVQGLESVEEHCPEYASAPRPPGRYEASPLQSLPAAHGASQAGDNAEANGTNPRPLWLLDDPVQLTLRRGGLYHRQAITLLNGPERIESRWWSGSEVCRDYYVAREAGGSRLWIYRERSGERHWYLHGYFA